MKKNILITGPYLPGKSYGGPVKSLYNMVQTLGHEYNFYIITGDRDLNSNIQYDSVKIGEWNKVGKAQVLYVPNGEIRKYLNDIISEKEFDIIYCSSFFAKASILIQIKKVIGTIKVPVIIAPRGEFSPGALGIKSFKKKVFLLFYKLLKINKLVTYTCTTENDKKGIINTLGQDIDIIVAGNIVSTNNYKNNSRIKETGYLNLVTVSRVSRIKNIDYSLKLLQSISDLKNSFKGINFDIYGPIEDEVYYNECLEIIKNIDTKINIRFMGPKDYDEIIDILSKYHVFLLPTKGENFGHVIQEAFLAGCPVIISDQTPWNNLERIKVGHDFPLKMREAYIETIKTYINMEQSMYNSLSDKSYEYGIRKISTQTAIEEHIEMFNNLKLSNTSEKT